nr:rep protein [Cressdnaviricota sp.]
MPKVEKSGSPVFVWDFTLSYEGSDFKDNVSISERLKKWCKHWVFQKEKGESGYVHWQGRVSLLKKQREAELRAMLPGAHWSMTAAANSRNFNYVMKEITRVEGPWSDKDEPFEPPPMTAQLREFLTYPLYAWQQKVERIFSAVDFRKIHVIVDRVGNIGKSIYSEWCAYRGLAIDMPPFRQMEDIMQCVMCQRVSRNYIVDMPRGMKKDKLGEFYSGLECLKNGRAYDKRYSYKEKRFDRPNVVVFTNVEPAYDLLSLDRWVVWRMTEDRDIELERGRFELPPPKTQEQSPPAGGAGGGAPALLLPDMRSSSGNNLEDDVSMESTNGSDVPDVPNDPDSL